jgi:hypothetical protein
MILFKEEDIPEKLKKPNPPRSIPPLVVVVHPRLATLASPASHASPVIHAAVGK